MTRSTRPMRSATRSCSRRPLPASNTSRTSAGGTSGSRAAMPAPSCGPLVLVAAGGVLVELLKDRSLALPPLDGAAARRLIDGLQIRPILAGVRGTAAADVDALAQAVARLSVVAADLGDLVDAFDVNPVIVGPKGCVAVDALR